MGFDQPTQDGKARLIRRFLRKPIVEEECSEGYRLAEQADGTLRWLKILNKSARTIWRCQLQATRPSIEQGPEFGNTELFTTNDQYRLEVPVGSRLKELRLFTDEGWLTSIQFVTIDRSGERNESEIVGAPFKLVRSGSFEYYQLDHSGTGSAEIIALDDDAFIKAISGEAQSKTTSVGTTHKRISILNLHTNKLREPVSGVSNEQPNGDSAFKYQIPQGYLFAGFYGSLAYLKNDNGGRYIQSLGLLLSNSPNPLELKLAGIFQDRSLTKPENRLKRNEHAFLAVTVANTHDLLNAIGISVGLDYDNIAFNDAGVTVEVPPVSAQGELVIGDLKAGESRSVPIKVSTANAATISNYEIAIRLLNYKFTLDQKYVGILDPIPVSIKVSS